MRPKQHEYRKRAREAETEDGEEIDILPGGQALPVADLPEDFIGEPEDGATYLALALRENANLPNFKTVENPYRVPSPPPRIGPVITMGGDDQPVAGPSRHPALPRPSWQVLFPIHFRNYRKHIAERWPPTERLPYPANWPPVPLTRQSNECRYFIQGHPRRRVKVTKPDTDMMDEDEALNADPALALASDTGDGIGHDEDEEAAMNDKPSKPTPQTAEFVFEPENDRHRPREPLVSVLLDFSPFEIIQLLGHITHYIENALSESELLLSEPEANPFPPPNPFPSTYSKWIFALLLILDQHLHSTDIYVLRELARLVVRVGAWRWVYAVTYGEVSEGDGWALGGRRKESSGKEGVEEDGVDEVLGRCWVCVYAIAEGWGQRDLLDDLERLFT